MLALGRVADDGRTLDIAADGGDTVSVHAMWLRDACRCPQCRRPTTGERLLDSTTIAPDITIESAADDGDTIAVAFTDGHLGRIDRRWLEHHIAMTRQARLGSDPVGVRRTWDGTTGADVETFGRPELDTDDGRRRWLRAIVDVGVALVHDVWPTESALVDVAHLAGPIRATNYGITWRIAATVDPVSAVDSERHLQVHTDLPYRDRAPGVQLLLATVVGVDGGATTLVDGYHAAEQLRRYDERSWGLLTTTEFTFPFVRDDIEYHGRAPLIGLGADGSYDEIRRAPDLVGVPIVDVDDVPNVYAALRAWSTVLDDPVNEVRLPLAVGDLLVFDNHRVLHGRTGFELGTEGRRELIGCYVDREDVTSTLAVLDRNP